MNYRQCTLERKDKNSDAIIRYTAYLPEKYAKIGECVKIKMDENWVDGWLVHSVSDPVDEKLVPDYRKAIRQHRARTGDALPR